MFKTTIVIFLISTFSINAQEVRIDWKDLNNETSVKDYIENQLYDYLSFKSQQKDTTDLYKKLLEQKSSLPAVYIRDKASISVDKPLVIINLYPINDQKILERLKLSDVKKVIILRPITQTFALYGSAARYGVIIIDIKKRKWKKVKVSASSNKA